ncbi:MAG: DUF3160 domain-containing protein [Patescibacteria group bacterium]
MPLEEPTILSSELEQSAPAEFIPDSPEPPSPLKKLLMIAGFSIGGLLLIGGIWFVTSKYVLTPASPENPAATSTPAATSAPATLPNLNVPETATTSVDTATSSGQAVEYLAFSDFYEAPDNSFKSRLNDYELPLNVKIDVMNYYDVSRKLDLDPGLDNLNNYGFTTIANPWPKEAPDFYSLYSGLSSRQIPLVITSDFLIYYYQNIFKKTFKDVEENVFYDNLWEISREMYNVAKNRYESRLAAIGDINDSVLEGERLEMAFFAVALELLKPTTAQVAAKGEANPAGLFTSSEADHFYFVVPPYLRDDVLAEVKLIRDGRTKTKSPVTLYPRNYAEFVVPADYLANAKLNNFYLTTRWLNSVFPLNYKGKDCPDCLLDQADWRINLTAASLIAQDFSRLPEVKNKWARIYKVMSFFKGLRAQLDYVYYRDALVNLFGADYNLEQLFDDQNKEATANLEKLRVRLLSHDFPAISGALAKNDPANRAQLGLRMLAEPYWPNDYIFNRLVAPAVTTYTGSSTRPVNATACLSRPSNDYHRCNGIVLDVINLVHPVVGEDYFTENTNYVGYAAAARDLRQELDKSGVWHLNNYWTTLSLIKAALGADKSQLPAFARSQAWPSRTLQTAAAAWINLQLPLDKFLVAPVQKGQSLDNLARWSENSYVEPNLALLNELLANNNMLLKMFAALQLEPDVRLALQDVRGFSDNLESLKQIVVKELSGVKLTEKDNEFIADFTKQLQVAASPAAAKQLSITLSGRKSATLREDLSHLRLLVIIHQEGNNKVFSVGPVWDYWENR